MQETGDMQISRARAGCQLSGRACILLGMSAALDILAIAAHRDDVEQTCGGTLLKAAQRGQRTGILDLTQGEMGTRGTIEDRAREADEGARILKVSWRRALDIPDGRVENTWENRLKVASVIRETRPRVVILPHWKARHPDHYTTSLLGYEACFLAGLAKLDCSAAVPAAVSAGVPPAPAGARRPLDSRQDVGATSLPPHRPFKIVYATLHILHTSYYYEDRPTFVVDITQQFEAKLAAIFAYKSQFGDQEAGKQVFPAQEAIRLRVEAMARFYGSLGGVTYAEPFLQKEIGLVEDLLAIPVKSI
jgi:LmbE family N-acetylglucosaminyl deacetylase